eukprot:10830-Heterococcus_DN1.PRE.2
MAPPQLAHFMKAAFGVKLTAGQLAAMFELFDADGSGEQCLLQCCAICSARTVFSHVVTSLCKAALVRV